LRGRERVNSSSSSSSGGRGGGRGVEGGVGGGGGRGGGGGEVVGRLVGKEERKGGRVGEEGRLESRNFCMFVLSTCSNIPPSLLSSLPPSYPPSLPSYLRIVRKLVARDRVAERAQVRREGRGVEGLQALDLGRKDGREGGMSGVSVNIGVSG